MPVPPLPLPSAMIVMFGWVVPPVIVWPTANGVPVTTVTVSTLVAIDPVKLAIP